MTSESHVSATREKTGKPLTSARTRSPMLSNGTERLAVVGGFMVVAGQRLSVDLGGFEIPFVAGLSLMLSGLLLMQRRVMVAPIALTGYLAILSLGSLSILANSAWQTANPSLAALMLLAALYLPCVFRWYTAKVAPCWGQGFIRGSVLAMAAGSILAIIQWAYQELTGLFVDPLSLLPTSMLVDGYNTRYEVFNASLGDYDSVKPNGMIFLEPSFLSLYAAVGIVYWAGRLMDPIGSPPMAEKVRGLFALTAFALGLAVSASATGVLIGAVGGVVGFASLRSHPGRMVGFLALSVGLVASGVFDSVIEKALEGTAGQTSTALRLVLPYQLLGPAIFQRPILGLGPGSADDIVRAIGVSGLQATTLLKASIEYGLLAVLLLALLVFGSLRVSSMPRPLMMALLAAWLVPSESLVNPTVVTLLVLGAAGWGARTENPWPPLARKWGMRNRLSGRQSCRPAGYSLRAA